MTGPILSCREAAEGQVFNPRAAGRSLQPMRRLVRSPVSLRRLPRVALRLLDQLLQGRVEGLLAGGGRPLLPDHALAIEDVECRRAGGLPLLGDASPVYKRPPAQLLLDHHF